MAIVTNEIIGSPHNDQTDSYEIGSKYSQQASDAIDTASALDQYRISQKPINEGSLWFKGTENFIIWLENSCIDRENFDLQSCLALWNCLQGKNMLSSCFSVNELMDKFNQNAGYIINNIRFYYGDSIADNLRCAVTKDLIPIIKLFRDDLLQFLAEPEKLTMDKISQLRDLCTSLCKFLSSID